jgi:hypothetical protein
MAGQSMPLYIFDEPLHAAIIIGFGAAFTSFATLVVYVAKHNERLSGWFRFDPMFFLIKRRLRTNEELKTAVPAFFWPIYGRIGRLFQVVGILVVLLGLIGLATSLTKKLM